MGDNTDLKRAEYEKSIKHRNIKYYFVAKVDEAFNFFLFLFFLSSTVSFPDKYLLR